MHITPPRGRAAGQDCPRAPEPVTAVWLADGAAGRGGCLLPPGASTAALPALLPTLGFAAASPLRDGDKEVLATRYCWLWRAAASNQIKVALDGQGLEEILQWKR